MASQHSDIEHLPGAGIIILRHEFSQEQADTVRDSLLSSDAYHTEPTYDDHRGSVGHIIWQHKTSPEIPPHTLQAVALLRRVNVNFGKLRAAQLNTQRAVSEQMLHTDQPFSSSLTIHLSPLGLFEYINNSNNVVSIQVDVGDVVLQRKAKLLEHRGRNPSDVTRFTLAMFFNGQGFELRSGQTGAEAV